MARMQSDRDYRDRIRKHMLTGEPPERPADYGRQSNRLLGELTEGIQEEDASGVGRVRLDVRSQLAQMRHGELGQAIVGDMTGDAEDVAPDQDIFGAAMLARVSRSVRLSSSLSGRKREMAEAVSARNAVALAEAAAELEQHAQELEVGRILAEYPDMSVETALEMAGATVADDGPVAA